MNPRLKTRVEKESGTVIVIPRREHEIKDGDLKGSEIVLDGDRFKIWTSKIGYARRLAKDCGYRIRELTGEVEIWLPMDVGLDVLKKFGAKVRREVSAEARAVMSARLEKVRNERLAGKKP